MATPHSLIFLVRATKAVQLREGASNHQSDVILLFAAAAELLDGADNVLKEGLTGSFE